MSNCKKANFVRWAGAQKCDQMLEQYFMKVAKNSPNSFYSISYAM